MSTKVTHTMTVTETTTSSPPKLAFNIEVLKTKDVILKFLQALIGIICMIMIFKGDIAGAAGKEPLSAAILGLCIITCEFPTLLLITSYLMSPMAANLIPKMIYELLNNLASSIFYVTTSMAFLILVSCSDLEDKEKPIALSVMGLLNAVLYFSSTYFSFQSFRSP